VDKEQLDLLINNLAKRNIKAFYYENLEDAREEILKIIPEEAAVGIGNSQTLKKMNISQYLTERGSTVYDKTLAKNKDDVKLMKKKALLSDWYITGSNAISMDGQIVNIDHSGNRVASMIFGPDKVIVVIGLNKIEETLDKAVHRARVHAAPMNAIRAGYNPPCLTLKRCVDCKTPERVCYNLVIIEGQHDPERMRVFIINDSLGF